MKQETIIIRCIAGCEEGFGNLNRCLILAKALKKKYNVCFLINYNKITIQKLIENKLQYFLIPKTKSVKSESQLVREFMHNGKYKIILLDMRQYGESISRELCGDAFKTILLDDAWCKNAYADLIFNGTMIKKYHIYKKINPHSEIFVGEKYFIIDESLPQHAKKISEIHTKRKYTIVISMGGSDPNDLTLLVLESLLGIDNVNIRVIIGPLFNRKNKLEKLAKRNSNIKLIENPQTIWKEFSKADVAISNAGTTLFELSVLRIPTICIPAIQHQIPYAEYFMKKGIAINLGSWNKIKKEEIEKTLLSLLTRTEKRRQMFQNVNKIIDGKGLSRVINIMEKMITRKA